MSEVQQQIVQLFDPAKLLVFGLVLARVAGLVLLAPVFGQRDLPFQFRAVLAVAIALLIAPVQFDLVTADPGTLLNFLLLVAAEAAIGLVLGLGVWIFLSGMQLAGHVISVASGLSLAESLDPHTGESTPVLSHLLYAFAIVVFVSIGGHRLVMGALLESFAELPIGRGMFAWIGLEPIAAMLQGSFDLGLRVAAPALVALLAATLAAGIIARCVPQLNALSLGLGLNSLLLFAVLALSLGGAAWALEDQIEPAIDVLMQGVRDFGSPLSDAGLTE